MRGFRDDKGPGSRALPLLTGPLPLVEKKPASKGEGRWWLFKKKQNKTKTTICENQKPTSDYHPYPVQEHKSPRWHRGWKLEYRGCGEIPGWVLLLTVGRHLWVIWGRRLWCEISVEKNQAAMEAKNLTSSHQNASTSHINHWTNLMRAETKRKKEFNLKAWEKETSNMLS